MSDKVQALADQLGKLITPSVCYMNSQQLEDLSQLFLAALDERGYVLVAKDAEPSFWTRETAEHGRQICEKPFTTDWEPLWRHPHDDALPKNADPVSVAEVESPLEGDTLERPAPPVSSLVKVSW